MRKSIVFTGCLAVSLFAQSAGSLGMFEGETDVGAPAEKGSASFDAGRKEYRLTAAGANMWAKTDEFHFVWRKMSGDISIAASLRFPESGGLPHRKIGLMIRQSLDPDAAYADAIVHGNGLTALQFRETAGDITRGVNFPVEGPARVKLVRRGVMFTMWTGAEGQPLQEAGTIQMRLKDPVYVGLAACSHDPKAMVAGVFSGVQVESPPKATPSGKK